MSPRGDENAGEGARGVCGVTGDRNLAELPPSRLVKVGVRVSSGRDGGVGGVVELGIIWGFPALPLDPFLKARRELEGLSRLAVPGGLDGFLPELSFVARGLTA